MKIIFLDIDGVLNSYRYQQIRTVRQGNIDDTRMILLKEIVEQTQASIVLSSTWRKHWSKEGALDGIGKELAETFNRFGLSISDKTPVLDTNDRADEIRLWMEQNGKPESFVILDDIAFGWGELAERLIKTDFRIGRGLEQKHVARAIALMNE